MLAETEPTRPFHSERSARFNATVFVEMHCHCLPGLDDGPATMEEALSLCTALIADGTTVAVATPHQSGKYRGRNGRAVVTAAVEALNAELQRNELALVVKTGGDIRLDEDLFRLLDAGEVLQLAAGPYLLLEMPDDAVLDLARIVPGLRERGLRCILSHPERHRGIMARPDLIASWLASGVLLQVTAGSVTGDFGPHAERAAAALLDSGAVSLIASDAHNLINRRPSMTRAIDVIAERYGHAIARRLCIEHPSRVVTGEPIGSPRGSFHRWGAK